MQVCLEAGFDSAEKVVEYLGTFDTGFLSVAFDPNYPLRSQLLRSFECVGRFGRYHGLDDAAPIADVEEDETGRLGTTSSMAVWPSVCHGDRLAAELEVELTQLGGSAGVFDDEPDI